jgi:hypothetical protein
MLYRFLADTVLVAHFGVVAFVLGGLIVVVVGNLLHWRWVNGRWLRFTHVAAVVYIAVQSLLGRTCPLTRLESWLRIAAGSRGYEDGFIEYWLHGLIFYDAPPWVFALAYLAFATLVIAAWWRFPPEHRAPAPP